MMTQAGRRGAIFGPEPWSELAGRNWCHFDRWFALAAVSACEGDLDALERELVGRLRSLHGRHDVEAKLSHLTDLRTRMSEAGVGARELAQHEPADKATVSKARRKVFDQSLEGRAMTDAMRLTPRVRLEQRARRGYWTRFPVDPSLWYGELAGKEEGTAYVPKGRSFEAVRRLRARLVRYDRGQLDVAERLGLHRAFHTLGLELADRADDSHGNIGELRQEAFATYVSIDWASTGMAPEDYWQDLCELVVAEPYALTHREETLPFRRVPSGQADLVEAILLELAQEWRDAYQDHNAEEAEELVAWLHLAGRRYHCYVDTARRLGSSRWMPIVALAESAREAGNRELAIEVFRAADQPGWHRDMLRERCAELTGARLDEATA